MRFVDFGQQLKQSRQKFQKQCINSVPGIYAARAYAQDLYSSFGLLQPQRVQARNWALIAVGGFGRGELSFASDLDLLLLYRKRLGSGLQKFIHDLVCDLWDAGFEVGHAVLSLSGLHKLRIKEFASNTAYLETCFLVGDAEFYQQWTTLDKFPNGPRQKNNFLKKVLLSRSKRNRQYSESIYLLEPHLKEGLGGLRDLHNLRWLALVFLDSPKLEHMCSLGWITAREQSWLEHAQDFLWRVRLQLHAMGSRKQDQLLLQDQEELAWRLGFESSQENGQAVEAFMRHYYWQSARVRRVISFLLERLEYESSPQRRKDQKAKVLSGPFVQKNELIWFYDPELIRANPGLLMQFFAVAATHRAHIQHETGQVIRESLTEFDERWRSDPKAVKYFFEILIDPNSAFGVLKIMLETGFLSTFLPEFREVRYRVQHDAYHTYTVDEHSLRTVNELHNLQDIQSDMRQGPDLLNIYNQLQQKEVLLLAGLIHDLGKGQGGEHARKGSDLAQEIGQRLGLGTEEANTLCRLVLNHLLLAETALKRDLSDEKPLERCALELGTIQILDMLYLLTLADSRATGPQAWKSWRISLLNELYFKLRKMMEHEDWRSADLQEQAKQTQQQILARLGPGEESSRVLSWLEGHSMRYLLKQYPEAIYRHFKMEERLENSVLQMDVRECQEGRWELSLVCRDQPGLFDLITGVLWANGLNVLAADIYTRANQVATDVMLVDGLPDPLHPDQLWERLKVDLENLLPAGQGGLQEYIRRKNPKSRVFRKQVVRKEDRVFINEQASDFYTVIEVYTWERPGVLHEISKTLHSFKLNIQLAKISTPGAQVLDVFYVTDHEGNKIRDPDVHDDLHKALLQALKNN